MLVLDSSYGELCGTLFVKQVVAIRKSGSVVAKEIAEKQKEYATRQTVNNYRRREGLKPFHVIARLLKSETHIPD